MRLAPRAAALTVAAFALCGAIARADRFEESLALANANAATPAGREFAQRIAARFDEGKLRESLVDCAESAKDEDVVSFTMLLELSGDGRASQVLLRPPVPPAVCLRWTVRETAFPRPPAPGYWVMVDLDPRRAPGAPPIPTAGVATATVPPTPTPAAPPAPLPPVSAAATPSATGTPPRAAAAPTVTPAPTVPASTPSPHPPPPPTPVPTPAASNVIDFAGIAAESFHVDTHRPDLGQLRRRLQDSRAEALGPLLAQADGIAPDDPRLEPYWSLAEELAIPVAIALGPEAPGAPPSNRYRAALGDPLKLETVLLRHPKLRVVVSGAGWPMGDAMVALMWRYPQVFVDTRVIAGELPRAELHAYLRRLVEAGFAKRILFASGPPGADPAEAIEAIQSAGFLSAGQKQDILYGNAARLLRQGR